MMPQSSENTENARIIAACSEPGRRRATFWSRCSPLAVMVLSAMLSAVPMALAFTHAKFTTLQFYDWVTQHRATAQVIINILASLLGLLWTWAVCTSFNMAMRSFLNGKCFPLNKLRLYVSLSRRTLDFNLPPRLAIISSIIWTVGLLPTWLWTGSLTPQADTTIIRATSFVAKTGPDSYPFLQAYDPRAAISESCDEVYQINGTFSKCPSRQKSGRFVESLASASVAEGRTRTHPKLDNSGYMYKNRSYGIGAAVGLQHLPEAGRAESYSFSELGYLVYTTCEFNRSSDFNLSGPILDTNDQPGVPNLFWAQGRRPNNDWMAAPKTAPGYYAT